MKSQCPNGEREVGERGSVERGWSAKGKPGPGAGDVGTGLGGEDWALRAAAKRGGAKGGVGGRSPPYVSLLRSEPFVCAEPAIYCTDMDHEAPRRYWFRAKRYGWGWGAPASWQGWVFTLAWAAITVPTTLWLGNQNLGFAYAFMSIMVAVLLVVCFMKGEPPRWRWGEKR